jgi:MFS family permease
LQELFSYTSRIKSFSTNARLYLLASLSGALYHSVFGVLGNLYIMQAGLNESFLGTMISLSSFSGVLLAIPAGVISDRIGRRRALLCGAATGLCAHSALILFPVPQVILLATVLSGAGGALMMVSGSPFLAENSTREERSHLFSITHAMYTVSGIGGSFLGGSLPVLWGRLLGQPPASMAVYRSTLLSAVMLLLVSIVPYILLKDAPRPKTERAGLSIKLERPRLVAQLLIPDLFMALGAGMFVPFLNVFFTNHLQASSVQIGFIFSAMSLVTTFAVLMAPLLGQRWGKVGAIVRTNLLGVPILLIMALAGNLWLVAGAALLRSAVANMCNPLWQAFNMEVLNSRERATVASMLSMSWSLGWGVSAAAGGYIMHNYSYTLPFYITIVFYILSAGLFHRFFAERETELTAAVAD